MQVITQKSNMLVIEHKKEYYLFSYKKLIAKYSNYKIGYYSKELTTTSQNHVKEFKEIIKGGISKWNIYWLD